MATAAITIISMPIAASTTMANTIVATIATNIATSMTT